MAIQLVFWSTAHDYSSYLDVRVAPFPEVTRAKAAGRRMVSHTSIKRSRTGIGRTQMVFAVISEDIGLAG